MTSNKQKRQLLKEQRALKKKKKERAQAKDGLRNGSVLPVDATKLRTVSCMLLSPPQFYKDYAFKCRDCGAHTVWTAKQQKWWYEEAGGVVESKAVCCRACRIKERQRKAEARKVHLDGIARKNSN